MIVSDEQIDALAEITNIGIGRAASCMNDLLGAHVELTVPKVSVVPAAELATEIHSYGKGQVSTVNLGFHGSFSGTSSLLFSTESASTLINHLVGEAAESEDMDEVRSGTLAEVGNMVLNGFTGSICNLIAGTVEYDVPRYAEGPLNTLFEQPGSQGDDPAEHVVIIAHATFLVQQSRIEGEILLLLEVGSLGLLLQGIEAASSR